MAGFGEILPRNGVEQMPNPATVKHLEYVANLDIEPGSELWEPEVFLEKTLIASSFAKFIRKHSTFQPRIMRTHNQMHVTLDSQMDEMARGWPGVFCGTLDIYPTIILPRFDNYDDSERFKDLVDSGEVSMDPNRWPPEIRVERFNKSNLYIVGRPSTDYGGESNNRYSLYIPLDDYPFYDPASERPLEARYDYSDWSSNIYDRLSSSARDNKPILHAVVRQAAADLVSLFHYVYGESTGIPELKPSTGDHVRWHPDYLTDDPDQFKKAA